YLDLHREEEMSRTLQAITQERKVFPLGYSLVGDFQAGAGRWEEASKAYSQGIQTDAKNRPLYQKKLAKLLISKKQSGKAMDLLGEVLKATSDDVDARLARAILLRESQDSKNLELAISELNALAGINPKDEVVQFQLGLAYLAKGDSKPAHTHLA